MDARAHSATGRGKICVLAQKTQTVSMLIISMITDKHLG
jgi:hypothetical protein